MDPHTHSAEKAAESQTVENLLTDLELGDMDTGGDDTIQELDEGDMGAVEVMEARDAAVAEQPVSTSGIEAPAPTEPPAAEKAAKTERKARAPKDINALDPSVFVLTKGDTADDAYKASVIAKRPEQKKIAEKFDNLFQSLAAGKKPSVYVMACFAALKASGTVKSTDLVAALKGASVGVGKTKGNAYNEGTARSQAGQMMVLFDAVGVATRDKQTLTLNDNSAIAEKLSALLAS